MNTLYVVATPIGNLEDISIRAIKTLLSVPVIACEDTRRTGNLINILEDRYGKEYGSGLYFVRKFISVRDWNEASCVDKILIELRNWDVALVSDAGTPLLSDPGYKVIRGCVNSGVKVVAVPGPFAAAAALSIAGLPTDRFMFWGFLNKGKIPELMEDCTHVIYESPERTTETLQKLKEIYPTAEIVVGKELTKMHEEMIRAERLTKLMEGKIEGEIVILVSLRATKAEKKIASVHSKG